MKYKALSVVAPAGDLIARGKKTIEVRSWMPPEVPLLNVAIIENKNYLLKNDEEDENAYVVAIVDLKKVESWTAEQLEPACSKQWSPAYFGWHITNVRRLVKPIKATAKRKVYEIELDENKVYEEFCSI